MYQGLHKAQAIRKRLGGSANMMDSFYHLLEEWLDLSFVRDLVSLILRASSSIRQFPKGQ
jgi:hypothetical protein